MISKNSKRFSVTFKDYNYDSLLDVSKNCDLSISQVLESCFVLVALLGLCLGGKKDK